MADPRDLARQEAARYLQAQGIDPSWAEPQVRDLGEIDQPVPPPVHQAPPPAPGPGPHGSLMAYSDAIPAPPPPPPAPAPAEQVAQATAPQATPQAPGPMPVMAPMMVRPAGFYPDKMEVQAKLGKPVPEEAKLAFGAASGLEMKAAGEQEVADKAYYGQQRDAAALKLKAADEALVQQKALAAERDAEVKRRLSEIEALNKQAQVKPGDVWNEQVLYGRFLGSLFTGLGMMLGGKAAFAGAFTGGMMNNLIEADISSKLTAKKSAAQQAGRQTDLLGHYLHVFGDKQRAIDATKLAYYDSALAQLEMFEAEHKGQLSGPELERRRAEILNNRAETVSRIAAREEADITQGYSQKYHMASFMGGGLGAKQPDNVVTLPDGTSYQMPNEKQQDKAIERIELNRRLIGINNRIRDLRRQTRDLNPVTDYEAHKSNMAVLQELEEDKLTAIEQARAQGVIREGEYGRKKELTGHATNGLGYLNTLGRNPYTDAEFAASERVLDEQTNRWNQDITNYPKSAGGKIVDQGYVRNPLTGELVPRARWTGQDDKPTQGLPPSGFKPLDPKSTPPVANRPARKTVPKAPEFPYRYTPPAPKRKR